MYGDLLYLTNEVCKNLLKIETLTQVANCIFYKFYILTVSFIVCVCVCVCVCV